MSAHLSSSDGERDVAAARQKVLEGTLARLTVESSVTVDRSEGDVFVDGELVLRFLDENQEPMEAFADTLWTHVEDLKAAAAGWYG